MDDRLLKQLLRQGRDPLHRADAHRRRPRCWGNHQRLHSQPHDRRNVHVEQRLTVRGCIQLEHGGYHQPGAEREAHHSRQSEREVRQGRGDCANATWVSELPCAFGEQSRLPFHAPHRNRTGSSGLRDWLWPAIWMLPQNSTYGAWPAGGEIDVSDDGSSHS
jgi:hypothetical protein